MAKGDYILFNNIPFQSVTSFSRRYGAMFNPSSSRSRLRIRDSGRRYGVRLNENGIVEYSIDGDANWQTIDSFVDPCTGQKLPKMVTNENLRIGEELSGIVFDMIAVGRGRIIGKEAGTDRLFHLYMDELFRTFQRGCNPGETNPTPLNEDPPIPPFNMKIDPEYFTDAPPTVVVPPEGTRDYSNHPASLRLPVFNQLLELDVADVMLLLERARTWYYKDNRSQLSITTQDDLAFTEQDVKDTFTQPVIKEILEAIKDAAMEMQGNLFARLLILAGFQPDSVATDWRRQLEEDGLLALVFPAYAALGALLWGANASKGVKRDPFTGAIRINLPAIKNFMNQPMPNPTAQRHINEAMAKFNEAVAELMLRSRRAFLQSYGARDDVRRPQELPDEWTIENKLPTPNQPPSWMPTVIRTTYTRSKSTGQENWRPFYHDELITKVWFGTNADGRLEAFGLGINNSVWHTVQAVPSGDWSGSWELLHGNEQRFQLAAARNSDGRLELFGLSPDNRIWHTLQKTPNGEWDDGWQELYSSNDRLKNIVVAQNSDGRLELLGVGKDDQVWRTFQKTPGTDWSGTWELVGKGKMSKVWVASNENGSLEAFAVSSDDRVWNMGQSKPGESWSGTWTQFYSDGDKLRSLAIGRNLNGQLEVIGVAADQRVFRTYQTAKNGPWVGDWEEHYPNGQRLTDVWIVSHIDGRLEAFAVQAGFPHLNDTVWHTWQVTPNENWNGSWVQITADGGRQDLAVAMNSDGHVEIIGIIPFLLNHASVIRMVRVKPSWHGVWKKFFSDRDNLHRVWMDTNADGRLEAFGLGPNNTVWNTSQTVPNGQWNPSWGPLYSAQDTRIQLASARNKDGSLELFGVSPDNRVFRTAQSAAGKDWNKTWVEMYKSTEKHTNLCVGANADGRLELFGNTPNDNRVWRTFQTVGGDNASWKGSWEELYQSSDQRTSLAVARNLDGRLQLFGIRPAEQTIWHTSQLTANGDWDKKWVQIGRDDDKLRSIVVGRNQDGRLEVFGLGPDNTVWHTSQIAAGKDFLDAWQPLYSPTDTMNYLWLVTNIDGRLELFGIRSHLLFFWENRVFHTWQTRPNGNWNGAWVEIEADWGRRTMAVAPNVDGRIEIIGIQPPIIPIPPDNPPEFPDDHVWNTRLLAEHRYAIQYSKVLDIGIGSSHWSESWQSHFGGEIHSLLQHRPLFQGEQYSLIQYRFLNGPVIDGDAFNDGTTNFYMMVKLGPPDASGAGYLQRYAILWFDEQTYFTTRWRLLHPTDDTLGDLFSLPTAMRHNPEWFDFKLAKYWCPFRADFIDDDSRMIVNRNIVVVTGKDRVQNRYEIYTIVFNYGLCDHSWRWRKFPDGKQVLVAGDIAQDQNPELPDEVTGGSEPSYVVVNTIALRDDTTLHLRGSARIGGTLKAGRWVQRYLPADCQHVPERHALTGRKPEIGYTHPWEFISEDAFQRADQFYQFGVYEDLVDSRAQYYGIDLLPDANGVTPRVEDVVGHVWRNDSGGLRGDQLRNNTINFVWALPKQNGVITKRISDPDNPTSPELFVHEFRHRASMSMYEPTTRFRILERKPMGLIAVFYDKRDDELQPASDLPQPTTFVQNDDIESQIPDEWKTEDGEKSPLLIPPPQPPSIRVMIKSNRRVYQPPNVRKVWMQLDKAPGQRELHLSFWTPQMEHEVDENIWRVSLAAIDETGRVVRMFSVLRFGTFVRRRVPQAPVPLGFRGELGDEWRYDWTWQFNKQEEEVNARRFCTPEAHFRFGTSLWFEDIIGHRAIAEQTIIE